ncbi:MAG: hypothetical protein HQL52_07795 [Magnetococcales bacterium]|nr:hypothetical protein [Magnetococcales bacterium]
MADYSGYVTAVYGIALAVYGGLTLLWQMRLRQAEKQLQEEMDSHEPSQ